MLNQLHQGRVVGLARPHRGLRAKALLQFKAQHIAIKSQRPFEVGDFQMNVADADTRINWLVAHGWLILSQAEASPRTTRQIRNKFLMVRWATSCRVPLTA